MTTIVKRIPDLPTATTAGASDYLLMYQGGVTKKIAVSLLSAGGVGALSQLSDVSVAGAVDGSLLTYNATQWVPTTQPTNQILDGGNF